MRHAVVLFFATMALAQDDDAAWHAQSIVRAGRVLFDLGEYEGAVAQFREALKKDDRMGDARSASRTGASGVCQRRFRHSRRR